MQANSLIIKTNKSQLISKQASFISSHQSLNALNCHWNRSAWVRDMINQQNVTWQTGPVNESMKWLAPFSYLVSFRCGSPPSSWRHVQVQELTEELHKAVLTTPTPFPRMRANPALQRQQTFSPHHYLHGKPDDDEEVVEAAASHGKIIPTSWVAEEWY